MSQTQGCSDPSFCRGGCCRSFFGTQFCDVESNCVASPTWLVILVPVALGVAAVVLLIILFIRLKNRKVIYNYDKVAQVGMNHNKKQKNNNQMALESERNMASERGLNKK